MRLKIFIFGFLFLFLLGMASGFSTTINVKTFPSHSIFVTPIAPGQGFQALESPIYGFSGAYGEDQIIVDTEANTFNLFFVIKKGDMRVYSKQTTKTFQASGIYDVIVLPEGVEPIVKPDIDPKDIAEISETKTNETTNETEVLEESNETETDVIEILENVNETEVLEEQIIESENLETGKQKTITGFASGENSIFNNNMIYYVGGGILLVIIALLIFKGFKHMNRTPKDVKEQKLDNLKEDKEERIEEQVAIIKETEEKIKEASKKIENIRGENKIAIAKKKLIADEQELMRLRREEREEQKAREERNKEKKEDKKDNNNQGFLSKIIKKD